MLRLALAGLLLAALTACSGGDDGDTAATTAEEVAPELVAALGVPATLHSEPAVETFGPDGGTLELADGATLRVPEGAFAEDTEVTVAIIDLDHGGDVEAARAYYVGTAEDVGELAAPVVLTVPGLSEDAVAVEHSEGDGWRAVSTATGGEVRIEMSHFSFQRWLLTTCKIISVGDPTAFLFCVESLAPGFCVTESALKGKDSDLISSTQASNFDACEEQFGDDFILQMLAETRRDLEAAGVSQAEITEQLERLDNCLELAQFRSRSDGQALEGCGEHIAVPRQTQDDGESSDADAPEPEPDPGPEPEPEPQPDPDPVPVPEPDPDPVPVPEEAEISFTEGPSGFILREYGPDDGCVHESCRDYEVTARVAWSGLTGPADLQCYGIGRLDEGFSVGATVPSGDMLVGLAISRWQFGWHPSLRCDLLASDGTSLAAVLERVQAY